MNAHVAVIAIGNSFRRDDGVGPVVAAAVASKAIPGLSVLIGTGDPSAVLDAWTGVRLASLVDATVATSSVPGRIHRCTKDQLVGSSAVSSHGVDIATLLGLGNTLGRMPEQVVLFAVEAEQTGYGIDLTPSVQAAAPYVVDAVLAEISARTEGGQRS